MTQTNTNHSFKLSKKEDWSKEWSNTKPFLTFDPESPFFRDIHRLFKRHLPIGKNIRCLEIGCYPGTYMWYFNQYFSYKVSGIEYVDECIPRCEEHMKTLNIDAEIIHADLFSYEPPTELWDVVTSFGFIEHFNDTPKVIKRHIDLLKPGGYLVLVIPNHAGLNGKILKAVDIEKYKIHNLMPYEQMAEAIQAIKDVKLIEGGYYGHMGFWNTALYDTLLSKGKAAYYAARAPLYVLERLSQYIIPNSRFLSPNSALIAQKL